jgi:hypothetical protein
MLVPSCRARTSALDLAACERALDRLPDPHRARLVALWRQGGPDAVLADPDFPVALCWPASVLAPVSLTFFLYAHVRQSLVRRGLDQVDLADYVATVVLEFGVGRRAWSLDRFGEHPLTTFAETTYSAAGQAPGGAQHLGNLSLWLVGLFRDRVLARAARGGPSLAYYTAFGRGNFRRAAASAAAEAAGVREVLETGAEAFDEVCDALRQVALALVLGATPRDPIEQLLVAAPRE